MADQLSVLRRGGGRKMGNPWIDPSHRIGDIRTIHGDFMPDKEIFCDIFLHPFAKSDLLLDSPSTVPHFPYLQWGFLKGSCERLGWEKENEESYQEAHGQY
jgi:hypothetical protein